MHYLLEIYILGLHVGEAFSCWFVCLCVRPFTFTSPEWREIFQWNWW